MVPFNKKILLKFPNDKFSMLNQFGVIDEIEIGAIFKQIISHISVCDYRNVY